MRFLRTRSGNAISKERLTRPAGFPGNPRLPAGGGAKPTFRQTRGFWSNPRVWRSAVFPLRGLGFGVWGLGVGPKQWRDLFCMNRTSFSLSLSPLSLPLFSLSLYPSLSSLLSHPNLSLSLCVILSLSSRSLSPIACAFRLTHRSACHMHRHAA